MRNAIHRKALTFLLVSVACLPLRAQDSTASSGPTPVADVRDNNLYSSQVSGGFVKKFATNVLLDQKAIWTSPLHINRQNAKWWILAGVSTAGLIAADHRISQALPFSGTSVNAGTDLSRIGQWYSVFPFAGGVYAAGLLSHSSKLKETGLESLEALADADITVNVVKVIARRQRPQDGDHGGHFEKGGSSFYSGHSTQAWALAAVIADEYGNHKWVPFVAYTYATTVSVSRVLAQAHFASDVLVGGLTGFFIGRYVVHVQQVHRNHLTSKHAEWLIPSAINPSFGPGSNTLSISWRH